MAFLEDPPSPTYGQNAQQSVNEAPVHLAGSIGGNIYPFETHKFEGLLQDREPEGLLLGRDPLLAREPEEMDALLAREPEIFVSETLQQDLAREPEGNSEYHVLSVRVLAYIGLGEIKKLDKC